MGERPDTGTRRVRFRKEVPILSNIDIDAISAKFEGSTLYVKLAKFKSRATEKTLPQTTTPTTKPSPAANDKKARPEEAQKLKNGKKEEEDLPAKPAATNQHPSDIRDQKEKKTSDANGRSSTAVTSDQTSLDSETLRKAGNSPTSTSKSKETVSHGSDQAIGGGMVDELPKGSISYKELLDGLVREVRTKRQIFINLAVASLVIVVLGVYVRNAVNSYFGGHSED